MYIKPTFKTVFLNLTDSCNLRCRYCFVEQHPHYMDLQTAKDTVELLMSIHRDDNESSRIQFFGGEPTLMWDSIIVPLVQYCEDKGYIKENKITFGITTNGILLTDAMMDFMQKYKFGVLLSCDGQKLTQDYNRPLPNNQSSFDILEPKLMNISHRFHPTFRATILPETCEQFFENIVFASKYEFDGAFFIPDWSSTNWTQEKIDILSRELRKYSVYFLDSYRQHLVPFDLHSYTRIFSRLQSLKQYQTTGALPERHLTACGLGLNGVSVSWDGKLYGCQELPSRSIRDNIYYIGDIYRGVDFDKIENLLQTYMNNISICEDAEYCKNCLNKCNCITNICHASSYMRCGNMNCRSKIECVWDRMVLNEVRFVSNILVANNNSEFMEKYNIKEII